MLVEISCDRSVEIRVGGGRAPSMRFGAAARDADLLFHFVFCLLAAVATTLSNTASHILFVLFRQLIRRRHPLTEACRNRAIVALTSGGHPDMALDMARGMEKDQHYADRATVEFVERCARRR